MTYRTHVLGGTASLWALALLPYGLTNVGVSAAFAIAGSLVPDLDSNVSKIQLFGWKGIRPGAIVGLLVRSVFRHRGPLHSWAALYVITVLGLVPLSVYVGWQPVVAFALGYASHLVLDMCTVRGLQVCWPSRRPCWVLPMGLRIVTASEWEDVYTALLGVASFALLIGFLHG